MITASPELIQKHSAPKPPTRNTEKRYFYPYVAVYTIDGIEHTLSGLTPSIADGISHAQQTLDHRDKQVEGEETKLVAFHFDVTEEEAEKIIADSSAKNPDQVTTDPLILHKPQNEVVG